MTSARDWKSRIRISNKETTGILKEVVQAKASISKSKAKASKFSTLSSLAIVSKGRHLRRQEH
jgi:hypothetical protein